MLANNLIKLIRFKDWLKNIIIFLQLIFSAQFFYISYYTDLLIGFLLFCIISSLIYVLNDILDIKRDSVHPTKKLLKPLANRDLSIKSAYLIILFLSITSVILIFFQHKLVNHVILYLTISLTYNFYLKKIPFVEIILLASGYIVRIDAGSYIINVESSFLMLSATYFLVIFFLLLKRLCEINNNIDFNSYNTRDVIKHYKSSYLRILTFFSILILNVTLILYVYTKNLELIITIVLLNIFLFLYYNYVKNSTNGENPINFILSNKKLLLLSILILISSFIIYV